jgi:hypothetical protein
MLVFISWSGEKSRYVAERLRDWLPAVLQQVDPWVSSEDIRKGLRWNLEIALNLQKASFGIICITKDNRNEPWILYESGALAKTLETTHICPYLIDIKPTELEGPLTQFQAARANELDTKKLLHSINETLGDQALSNEQIERSFNKWWPELNIAMQNIPNVNTINVNPRSERSLLEEVLELVRRKDLDNNPKTIPLVTTRSEYLFPTSLVDGNDISNLLNKTSVLGTDTDMNASTWNEESKIFPDDNLNGLWSSRWNGGIARGRWVTGNARIQIYGPRFYVIAHDHQDYFIAAKILGNQQLAGRFINLGDVTQSSPWVGLIVNSNRIDGQWNGGRWDFRRI